MNPGDKRDTRYSSMLGLERTLCLPLPTWLFFAVQLCPAALA